MVYCLEGVDNGERLHDCAIDPDGAIEETESALTPLPTLRARGWQRKAEGDWLYRPYRAAYEARPLTFIPYYAFANRGENDMRVWVPVRASAR